MIIFWKDNDNNDVDDDRTADDDDSGQCVCVVCWALPVCNWKQSSKQFVFPIHCRGFLVRLVMCVMVGHRKLKIEIIKRLAILF